MIGELQFNASIFCITVRYDCLDFTSAFTLADIRVSFSILSVFAPGFVLYFSLIFSWMNFIPMDLVYLT